MVEHRESDAICFCSECKIYMCNKCEKLHFDLFNNLHQNHIIIDKNINEAFSGICTEENHTVELIYFCRTHNKLCCAECITKIKAKKNGQHKDCDVCLFEDIEDEKLDKLNENIECLEDLYNLLLQSIDENKKIFEKIIDDKEKLKMNIQKVFTKIRNELNNREDILLLEVEKQFYDFFLNEDIIKDSEKLPNKIKNSLEKGKLIDFKNKDNNKLNSIVNDCLNIEYDIIKLNDIKTKKI